MKINVDDVMHYDPLPTELPSTRGNRSNRTADGDDDDDLRYASHVLYIRFDYYRAPHLVIATIWLLPL